MKKIGKQYNRRCHLIDVRNKALRGHPADKDLDALIKHYKQEIDGLKRIPGKKNPGKSQLRGMNKHAAMVHQKNNPAARPGQVKNETRQDRMEKLQQCLLIATELKETGEYRERSLKGYKSSRPQRKEM